MYKYTYTAEGVADAGRVTGVGGHAKAPTRSRGTPRCFRAGCGCQSKRGFAHLCAPLRSLLQLGARKVFFVGKEKRGRLAGTLAPPVWRVPFAFIRLYSALFAFLWGGFFQKSQLGKRHRKETRRRRRLYRPILAQNVIRRPFGVSLYGCAC